MKKFEARTLEEAYRIACDRFGCSISELKYEIVQYPSGGIFGLFAKPAVIVAMHEKRREAAENPAPIQTPAASPEPERQNAKPADREAEKRAKVSEEPPSRENRRKREKEGSHEEIIDRFFEEPAEGEAGESPGEKELQAEIEAALKDLMDQSCFEIDVIEVDVIDDTAYIFMDGEDAALLIGKEGYRYNALSYLLFNWIHSRYNLYIKLEVAQFLSSQQEMIRHTLQPVIEHVEREGWGRTRPLDGILVQIALEQLREAFPNKYVAIKRQRDGSRYVLINEFNSRRR